MIDVRRRLQFFLLIFSGTRSKNFSKPSKRNELQDRDLKAIWILWIVSPISWIKGLKMRPIRYCNNKDAWMYRTPCFGWNQDFVTGFFPENSKSTQFKYFRKAYVDVKSAKNRKCNWKMMAQFPCFMASPWDFPTTHSLVATFFLFAIRDKPKMYDYI